MPFGTLKGMEVNLLFSVKDGQWFCNKLWTQGNGLKTYIHPYFKPWLPTPFCMLCRNKSSPNLLKLISLCMTAVCKEQSTFTPWMTTKHDLYEFFALDYLSIFTWSICRTNTPQNDKIIARNGVAKGICLPSPHIRAVLPVFGGPFDAFTQDKHELNWLFKHLLEQLEQHIGPCCIYISVPPWTFWHLFTLASFHSFCMQSHYM